MELFHAHCERAKCVEHGASPLVLKSVAYCPSPLAQGLVHSHRDNPLRPSFWRSGPTPGQGSCLLSLTACPLRLCCAASSCMTWQLQPLPGHGFPPHLPFQPCCLCGLEGGTKQESLLMWSWLSGSSSQRGFSKAGPCILGCENQFWGSALVVWGRKLEVAGTGQCLLYCAGRQAAEPQASTQQCRGCESPQPWACCGPDPVSPTPAQKHTHEGSSRTPIFSQVGTDRQ